MINNVDAIQQLFRERLTELVGSTGLNRSQFARMAQIDRSTLTQLLSPDNRRMPRVETLLAVAEAHQTSLDWLLGLTMGERVAAEMMTETATIEEGTLTDQDERLMGWWQASRGYKVRYVPQTLPDMLRTPEVIDYELRYAASALPSQRRQTAADRLAWVRDPSTELEICSSTQSVRDFALGAGIWESLPTKERLRCLDNMVDITDSLYPKLRWFLFDGRERYSVPITIFGPLRASIYLGQGYLVLTSASQVLTCIEQFDDHIRSAVVQPPDMARYLDSLKRHVR